jgi:hypothetical protein
LATETTARLQQFLEFAGAQLTVAKDLVQQAWADGFAGVRRHNRAPAIFVTKEVMAAFDAKNSEASPPRAPQ